MAAKIEGQLGKGACATVYLLKLPTQTPNQIALKVIEKRNQQDMKKLLKEMDIMTNLPPHQNIVHYYGGHKHRDNIYLFLEYCRGSDLYEYLQSCKPYYYLSEEQVLKFASQIASAITFLHRRYIMHRDIKPKNILLTQDETVKLADFGISSQLENTLDQAGTFAGTGLYMAPEIFQFQTYSYKADAWSFGCCLHELMSLYPAFKKNDEPNSDILKNIRKAQYHSIPEHYSDNLQQLVRGLLVVDEDKRHRVTDVYSFLQGMIGEQEDEELIPTDKPHLPDKKVVVSAIKEYNIQCNLSSSSEDNDSTQSESCANDYADDFESSGSSLENTLQRTVLNVNQTQQTDSTEQSVQNSSQTASNSGKSINEISKTWKNSSGNEENADDADLYAKQITNGLRRNLQCLNMDEDVTVTIQNSDNLSQKSETQPETVKASQKKKKKLFLKGRSKSREEKEAITLYTRSQKVAYTKPYADIDQSLTTEQKCIEEIGNDKYTNAISLCRLVKDPEVLEYQLKEMLGRMIYGKYQKLFLKKS